MARVLAVTWDGGGNVPPLLGVATQLVRRGHEVRVLGHAGQRDDVEAAGLAFVAYRHARPWAATDPLSGPRHALAYVALFSDRGPGRDVAAEVGDVDLVLADAMSLAALQAAQRAGVPTVVLVHLFRRYLTAVWARGPMGLAAAVRGMRPTRLWDAARRVLVASDPVLDPGAPGSLSGNVRYVGPVGPPVRPAAVRSEPLVLVSLSTIFYPGQEDLLARLLEALAPLPLRVVVTTGPAVDPDALDAPSNAEIVRYRPHGELMPQASLVVSHGGHSTAMLALAHDLPVLVLPLHPQLDHPLVGAAIADAGAGRVLPAASDPPAIRDAVRELVADGPHRGAAAAIGARLRARDGAAVAADEIEIVLRGRERASARRPL
ncbi:nucleotide disphospho-sugar-binding domain-containing protein [Actinomycetospora sp. NBRC 106375]|uniref:glycosyltransferase n=1 Tax=Actinomycetospora sp. NBRC 106375 TaxID=3032207 RepID=UPI0025536D7D|nr:nucleotide disphospho-sugar-binding domain-containing protein [Actinomycetospora sp. NBRC 106375]